MGLDHILWAALLTNRSMKLTEPLVIARPSHGPRCRLVKALAGSRSSFAVRSKIGRRTPDHHDVQQEDH